MGSKGWFWWSRLGLSTAPTQPICFLGVTFWQLEAWEQLYWRFPAMLATSKKTPVWSNQFDAKFKEKIHACKAHNTYFPQSICYTQSLYTSLNGDAYTTTQTCQTLVSCFTRKISAFTTRPKSTLFSYATSTLQGGVFNSMHIIKKGLIYYLMFWR